MSKIYEYKSKEWLYQEYVMLKKSLRKIGRECGMSGDTIRYWLRKYGISRRTVSESLMGENNPMYGRTFTRTEKTKDKMSAAKTGEKNPNFGNSPSKETRIKISMANIGKVRTKEMCDRMRIINTGESNPNYIDGRTSDPQYRKRYNLRSFGLPDEFVESALIQKKKRTDIESVTEYWLLNNKISYKFQRYIKLLSTYTKIDFFIEPNICLYCDGNRWHELEERRLRDERITKELESMGYEVIRIWGSDIRDGVRPWEILRLPQLKYEQRLLVK